jgi:hypothetical protein
MIIVWGRKVVRRKAGYVADFCPCCRDLRPFTLYVHRLVPHIQHIPLGFGDEVGFDRVCNDCRAPYGARDTTYAKVSRRLLPLQELKQTTYPSLDSVSQERLELEERVRSGRVKLSPEDRFAWVKAPFMYLSPRVERGSMHMDKELAISLAGCIVLYVSAGYVTKSYFPGLALQIGLTTLAVILAVMVWQLRESGSRFMRRQIVPTLARSLRPLQPTQEEIEAVLWEIKQGTHKIAKRLDAAEVMEQIRGTPEPFGLSAEDRWI